MKLYREIKPKNIAKDKAPLCVMELYEDTKSLLTFVEPYELPTEEEIEMLLEEERVFESDKTTFLAHYGAEKCPIVTSERKRLAKAITNLLKEERNEI